MPRFAANLSTMFTEFEPRERFVQAAAAGFSAVEYLLPYSHPITEVKTWLGDAGLELILVNTRVGDASAGERGLAALPGREEDYKVLFEQALDYAASLNAGMIHVMAGVVPQDQSPESCEATFIANLQASADLAAAEGVRILIEPLNTRDVPGYLHTGSNHARRIIEAVDRNNVQMQFDFYHLQIMEGDLGASLRRHLDVIGHVQFSSLPGRHEPQYGEVNMPWLFQLLDDLDYNGWIGCEYGAKDGTSAGLSWAQPYGIKPA